MLSLAIKVSRKSAIAKERLVVFGLPRTGKTAIGQAVTGSMMLAEP